MKSTICINVEFAPLARQFEKYQNQKGKTQKPQHARCFLARTSRCPGIGRCHYFGSGYLVDGMGVQILRRSRPQCCDGLLDHVVNLAVM